MAGSTVILDDNGKPIEEDVRPPKQDGYTITSHWVDVGDRIVREYEYEPLAGSQSQAMLALARLQADSLTDAQALQFKAIYPEWSGLGQVYKTGDRLTYQGTLYKVLQDHKSQPDWSPDKAPSLFAQILPGQDGKVGAWEQPDSTNPYRKGDRVTYQGHLWQSTADGNVWAPGATGAPWEQVK